MDTVCFLVAGGTGFLGHHLVQDLAGSNNPHVSIHVLDQNIERNRVPSVHYHQADISCYGDVERIMQQVEPDCVFHAVSPDPFEFDRTVLERVNVAGTRNLLKCAQTVGTVKAFVYTSSSSVIHDHYHALVNADERSPVIYEPQQPNLYSHTKALAETHVLAANRAASDMLTAAIRPASIYGEGSTLGVHDLVKNAQSGRANMRIGPGNNGFDYTYVKNCTHAHILAANALLEVARTGRPTNDEEARVDGEAFFVTDEDRYTFWEICRLVAELAGHPVRDENIRTIPVWLMLVIVGSCEWLYWIVTMGKKMKFSTSVVRMLAMERTFDTTKVRQRLGYRRKYSTREGLERTVRSILQKQQEDDGKSKPKSS